ncbi:RDD family protein [Streptomyces sp. NBC_00249]|uniref:RDD family protein n=1 Tax=Streptomyces sp. NBC_00249 TaxID=2975690 RepID=UPI002B1E0119|nr:RDD family protein [Streptomyces sp. NBC_00249]
MPDPLAGMPPLADFGQRLAARAIDALIVFIPVAILSGLAGNWHAVFESDSAEEASDITRAWAENRTLWAVLIAIVFFIAYDWFFTRRGGQTLGKKMFHLRVAMLNDGSVPTSGAALGRAATLWVPNLFCCCWSFVPWSIVLIISILVDKPYKQGLHDKVAKTVVVKAT